MRTFQQVSQLRAYLRGLREEGKSVGFVPTMGALHDGHLSLFQKARGECDIVVGSLFVNPTQFNDPKDYEAYPRDLTKDSVLAANAGVDALFMPELEEMYPPGSQTVVDVPELGTILEGAQRPGHFRGVATVVTKLLLCVQPDRAYFGLKDYQQVLVVERLVRDLHIPVTIVRAATVRETDGLAMSSRNARLTPEERAAAPVLYRALQRAETLVKSGVHDSQQVQHEVETVLASEPLAQVEYVALVHPDTLRPLDTLAETVTLVSVAARFGSVRLIDNLLIAPTGVPLPNHRPKK